MYELGLELFCIFVPPPLFLETLKKEVECKGRCKNIYFFADMSANLRFLPSTSFGWLLAESCCKILLPCRLWRTLGRSPPFLRCMFSKCSVIFTLSVKKMEQFFNIFLRFLTKSAFWYIFVLLDTEICENSVDDSPPPHYTRSPIADKMCLTKLKTTFWRLYQYSAGVKNTGRPVINPASSNAA